MTAYGCRIFTAASRTETDRSSGQRFRAITRHNRVGCGSHSDIASRSKTFTCAARGMHPGYRADVRNRSLQFTTTDSCVTGRLSG